MIFTERTIKVNNDISTISNPIILYRGDYNVEVRFTILDCPYKYSENNSVNVIETVDASYCQLVIKVPNDRPPIFSDIVETKEGCVIFTFSGEMIDESIEVGDYNFQIRLFDANQESRATIPPVENGIKIREPIAFEDVTTTNEVGEATVGYALTTADTPEEAFDGEGNYNKTTWKTGNKITAAKLNKIEAGIDGVNKKVDLSSYAKITDLPTKTSQLTNDSGYITNIPDEYITETELNEKGYATTSQIPTVPTNVSEFTNDANYASETYVNNKVAEIDLSGYVTKETGNANQITFADGQTFQSKLDTGALKGDKGDKGDTGEQGPQGVPGKDGLTTAVEVNGSVYQHQDGTITLPDYPSVPTNISAFTNDANYATEAFVTDKIAEASLSGEEIDLSTYQTKTDNALNTTDKTVVGAINEINETMVIPEEQAGDITVGGISVGGSSEAKDITITDIGGYYEATNVEGALQEAGSQIKDIKKYRNETNLNLLNYNISKNDDISNIINNINNDCVANNKRVNIIIPFNCRINNKIIIDCNYVSLKGDKVIIDTSDITDTVCVEITSNVSSPYAAPKVLIDGVSFNDNSINGKDTKTGLFFNSSNGEVAHLIIQNCSISGYRVGEEFGRSAYLIKHINTNLYNCNTIISVPNTEIMNNGENISYFGCAFFNSGLVINNNFSDCDFTFINCSFDYNNSFFINKGKIKCSNCHFENKDFKEIQFVNEGLGSTYINNSFLVFHFPEDRNSQNNYVSSTNKDAFLSIKDSYMTGTLNIYNTFNTGEGNVLLENIHSASSYVNNTRVDNKYNLMIDGDFTSSSIVDNISITKDTSAIENRFSGANCTLALENELLTVTKQWGAGSDCAFSFYFDIDYGEWFDCDFTCKADADMTGELKANIYFANVKYLENGLHQVNKKELVSTTSFFLDSLNDFSKIIFPIKAKNINKIYNSVIVEFDMYYIVGSNNKFYIDNFFANTY